MAIHLAALVLAEGSRVVLIGPSPDHPLVARMRDELKLMGFEVELMPQSDAALDLAAVGRGHGAAAVARVEAAPAEIFLWVDPARSAGGGSSAELRVSASVEGPMEPGLLPLRAAELLRGRLIRVLPVPADGGAPDVEGTDAGAPPAAASSSARVPPPPPGPPPSATAAAQGAASGATGARIEGEGRLSLHVAAAVLLSPGGIPAAPQVRVGAAWSPVSRVSLEAMVFLPTTASTVSSPEGDVHVRVLDLGADFRGQLTDPGADLSIAAGLGLGAMLLFFDGEPSAPYVGVSGSRWVPAPFAALTVSYRLARRFALRGDILAALARPEPVVRIVDREAASFGQPAVFLSLGAEVRP